jgi:glyoxylase-like metal-dependent hydrolase (beta-lactamase superfamily II)
VSQEEPLLIEQIEIGAMQNFTYFVGSRTTREIALVDPAWRIESLLAHADEQGLTPVAVLVTHWHFDHVGGRMGRFQVEGLPELMALRPLPVYVHREDVWNVQRMTGLSDTDLIGVDSGHRLRVGEIEVEFLHTPGHTRGSQCFRVRDTLVSGDTLFLQGCGRTDLPDSDVDQMYESMRKLDSLPEQTIVLPGHNYSHESQATLGEVRKINPSLRVSDLTSWRRMVGA